MGKDRLVVHWRDGTAAVAVLGAVLTLLVLAPATGASVHVVNTTSDATFDQVCSPTPGDCTLREALAEARGDDSVTLPGGVYNLNPEFNELDLIGADINGAGARSTIIDGGNLMRVLATQDDSSVATPGSPQITGVTIRRGRAQGTGGTMFGGGIQVTFGSLTLVNSQVLNSTAEEGGGGIGLGSGADLFMFGSTVAGNSSTPGSGGGIYSDNEGTMAIVNSTISGNSAVEGGGLYGGGGSAYLLVNATVASNSGRTVGGLLTGGNSALRNTILAGNAGAQCSIDGSVTSNNSLSTDATCGLVGNGNLVGVNPGLGALSNNGGPTDTRAIGPASIAVNHGGAGCQTTDQRGVARPQGGVCDIGAFEYRAPRLTVVKRVVNDHGLDAEPSDFSVHVRAGAADVAGSPQPGTATGTTYTLTPGTYTVAEDANSNYVATFSGACNASGALTLAEGSVSTCTVTNDDRPPRARNVVNASPKSGIVKIKLKGRKRFRRLREGEQIPVGTTIDTLRGRVTLVAAANRSGGTAKADFYDGIFKLSQTKGSRPITVLTLVEKLTGCTTKKKASAAAKKKRKRRLWGNGSGRFRTKGRHSAATVVGTIWLVEDRCTSTLTKVRRGKVKVRDFVKKKTVTVKAPKRYIARKRR